MQSIKSSDRVFIAGKTGSGKTYLAKVFWSGYNRRIYIDPKIENASLLDSSVLIQNPQTLSVALSKGYTSILYQPSDLSIEDFDEVCRIIYNQGNFTIFNDECSYYTDSYNIPHHLREIMMRGRSRNVGIINLSQRPNSVNNLCISEAEHHFIFKLLLDADIQKLKIILSKEYQKIMPKLPIHHYIYSNIYEGTKLCKPI